MRESLEHKGSRPREPAPDGNPLRIAVGIVLRGNRVLVTRRRPGTHLEGAWEFPGGKTLPGEDLEAALRREMAEEVGLRFEKATLFHLQEHVYSDRAVDLHFFLCTGASGEPSGAEGQKARWVSARDLDRLPTPPANAEVIGMLKDQLSET